METRFTRGEWKLRRSPKLCDGAHDYAIYTDDPEHGPQILAEAFGRSGEDYWPPVEANAHLIAAAPDLYEALAALWHETELAGNANANDFNWPKVRELTLAALSKAVPAPEGKGE